MSDTPTPEQQKEGAPAATPVTHEVREERTHRGGMFLGVILIIAGVLFLGGRFLPWLNLTSAWPLIVVALGVAQAIRGRDVNGVLDGVTTIVIGGILLANTTGYLSWGAWAGILSLWPLLLVSAGLAIIGRAVSQTWLRVVAQLLIIAGLLYGALAMPQNAWRIPLFTTSWESGPMTSFSETARRGSGEATVSTGEAAVRWGAAEVNVEAGPDVASMSGTAPRAVQPKLTVTGSGGAVDVEVGSPGGASGAGPGGRLDVTLGRDVRWESLVLALGGSSGTIDLSGLEVDKVELDTGASDTTIVVGDKARNVQVRVNSGVANVVLRVPKAAFAAVRVQGLVASTMPSGFRRVGGTVADTRWEGGPADASVRIDAEIRGGIANVDVETY